VLDGFLHHFLHRRVGNIHGGFHLDNLLRAGPGVARQDVQDAVGVDLKLDADARDAFGRGLRNQG
jgi:hypothetical protein